MTLVLACRGAAFVANSAPAALGRARVAVANAATPAARMLSRRTALGVGVARRIGGSSLVHCANGGSHTVRRSGMVTMCSGGGAAVEVSAEGLELEASIKAKGDTIRELKAGGASKDDLKPHIEVRVPQLIVDL